MPLWLALALHGMKRCRLLPPDWLSPASLAAVDEAERASGSRFEPLPEGFLEVGRLLLTRCRGEFETREYDEVREGVLGVFFRERERRTENDKKHSPLFQKKNAFQIAGLLESVRSARYGKLRDGISQLTGPMAVKLTNITASELNAVRPFFLGALTAFAAVSAPPGGSNAAAAEDAQAAAAAPAAAATGPPPPAPQSQQKQPASSQSQQQQQQQQPGGRFRTRNR